MRILKRMAALLLAVVMAGALLAGCSAAEEKAPQSIRVGVSIYRGDDTFITSMVKYMELYAAQLSEEMGVAIDLKVEDAKRNQSTQNKQIENFLSKGYDVIVVNPVDRTMANYIINKAEKADTPVIFFNREPVESDMQLWDKVYYVGADAWQSGEMMGQVVVDAYRVNPDMDKNGDGRLQYVMLEGEPTHQDSTLRSEASVGTITNSGIEMEMLAGAAADWERGIGAAKMTTWIEEFDGGIELVMANNDDMALGALDALRGKNMLADGPAIVGIDGNDAALQEIRDGAMLGSVVNDSYGQSKGVLDLAVALAGGGDLSRIEGLDGKYLMVPYYIVTKDNAQQEIDRRLALEKRG